MTLTKNANSPRFQISLAALFIGVTIATAGCAYYYYAQVAPNMLPLALEERRKVMFAIFATELHDYPPGVTFDPAKGPPAEAKVKPRFAHNFGISCACQLDGGRLYPTSVLVVDTPEGKEVASIMEREFASRGWELEVRFLPRTFLDSDPGMRSSGCSYMHGPTAGFWYCTLSEFPHYWLYLHGFNVRKYESVDQQLVRELKRKILRLESEKMMKVLREHNR